ncbi:MAG TPA: T9SS type A sorting domain-containing protein [Bacteroidia bacterium]|nr:T9SS type A sorting domain-containing protein [Bacteroidia bacterium]
MNCSKLFIGLLLVFNSAFAQTNLLQSFKTDSYGGPSQSVKCGSNLFFSAYDDVHGRELWVSDGTAVGTRLVKDIYSGTTGSIGDYFNLLACDVNGILYFRAKDSLFGNELWRSDGTTAGTYMVKDISPGTADSNVGEFEALNGNIYFTANTGSQVWRSDGTGTGTTLLGSFNVATNLCAFNGNLYFAADNNNNGQELWKSNGTAGGTVLLKDLNGTVGASLPCNFHSTPSLLYFMANTSSGWELWKSNGTSGGTTIVKEINPSGNGVLDFYSEASMANIGDTIFFRAQDGINGYQFWRSDGTVNGTYALSNLTNGPDSYCSLPTTNGKVYFNNYLDPYFYQYNSFDGTLSQSNYPSSYYFNIYQGKYLFLSDYLFYAGKDSIYGCELYYANGVSSPQIVQETHLTDNWFSNNSQGFNTIIGSVGSKVLFTLARNPLNTEIPIYVIDTASIGSGYPPSIIVPVYNGSTAMNLVWNRTENTDSYEIRYKKENDLPWSTLTSDLSFTNINNLDSTSNYQLQLRSVNIGNNTGWSDTILYNPVYISNSYNINIIAERAEDDSTVRIYWEPSLQITNLQIRYRLYGSTAWTNVYNSTGMKKLTGLQPNSFYEYQYRANYSGTWDVWQNINRYFVTPSLSVGFPSVENLKSSTIKIYPNPCSKELSIISGKSIGDFIIQDNAGRTLKTEKTYQKQIRINVEEIPNGIYFIKFLNSLSCMKFIKVGN